MYCISICIFIRQSINIYIIRENKEEQNRRQNGSIIEIYNFVIPLYNCHIELQLNEVYKMKTVTDNSCKYCKQKESIKHLFFKMWKSFFFMVWSTGIDLFWQYAQYEVLSYIFCTFLVHMNNSDYKKGFLIKKELCFQIYEHIVY